MDPKIIGGTGLAKEHEEVLKKRVAWLPQKTKIVSILVGDNSSSLLYSNLKKKKASDVGIEFELKQFSVNTSWEQIIGEIEKLNRDESVTGVMVQLPLPVEFLDGHTTDELLARIDPQKDVDGLTGKGPVPQAAVRGVLSILDAEKVDFKNSQIVVVGAKGMVGSELVKKLRGMGVSVDEIEKETEDPCEREKEADVLISAAGKKNLITVDCVKDGAIVIDVGGDVDFDNVKERAGRITPPKGGVGPMTVVSLMENAVELAHGFNGFNETTR